MSKKKNETGGCSAGQGIGSCCRIESLVSIDERGQMILPKDIRDRAGIKAGDKMALVTWEKDGEICCVTMIKADALGSMVTDFLGPMMSGISGDAG